MADYKIDPHLQQALLQGRVSRIAIDLDLKKITVWYRSRDLSNELDRLCDKHMNGHTVLKSDYAFDIRLLVELKGLFVIDNESRQDNHKAEFRFDLYKNVNVENTRD